MFKMTPTILKNLMTEKATRLYPFDVRPPYAFVRGELIKNIENCNFCGICAAKCPSQCLRVEKKSATWECTTSACLFCGVCVDACPKKSLTQKFIIQNKKTGSPFLQGDPVIL